jgi:hypothetical protein
VAHAAHLVLDGEQHPAVVHIDDVLEAILVLVALLGDQAPLQQPAMRAGEVGKIDGDVVAVESRGGGVRLAEDEMLAGADRGARKPPALVLGHVAFRAQHLAVEAGDAVERAARHLQLDIRHAEHHAAEALAGAVAADAVAPGAGRLDVVVVLLESEPGPSSGFFTAASRRTSASRLGTTSPVWPRRTCAWPVADGTGYGRHWPTCW